MIVKISENIGKSSENDRKKIGKKLVTKIKDGIIKFYNNVLKKIISRLKEYAKQGIEKFAEVLGIDINGSAEVKVNF